MVVAFAKTSSCAVEEMPQKHTLVFTSLLLPVYEHVKPEAGQHSVLELWILVHYDGHYAHVREEASRPANYVLPR